MTTATRRQVAPGPGRWTAVTEMFRMQSNPAENITVMMREYGEIVRYYLGPYRVHFLGNPEGIQYVLQENNRNYRKSEFYEGLVPVLGRGLVTSDGDLWRRQRRVIQPAFQRERIAGMLGLFTRETRATMNELDRIAASTNTSTTVDVARLMMKLTFDIIGKALFTTDISGVSDEVYEAVGISQQEAFHRALSPVRLPLRWPTPHNRRYRDAVRVIDRLVHRLIAERHAMAAEERPRDLLHMLLETRYEDGSSMPDELVRDEAVTALGAGHETTANALTWTLYLLSQNPDQAERLREECRSVLGDRPPTAEDLPRLEYAERVLKEGMRLYPPAWIIERNTLADDEILGYHIPKNTIVSMPQYVVHRDPNYWENPERFDPDRFLPERSEGRPRFAYFPFGGGQRMCIGEHFAMLEARVILVMLAARYEFRLKADHPVETEPLVTLRPKYGLPMHVRRL